MNPAESPCQEPGQGARRGDERLLKIQTHDSWDDCGRLSTEWNRLVEDSVHPSIYLTFEYLSEAWTRIHAKNIRPLILEMRDPVDRLVCLAPLGLTQRREGGIKRRVVTYVATLEADIDKPYIIVKPDYEIQAWKAIADFFLRDFRDWDLLDFFEIPDDLLGRQCLVANFHRDEFYLRVWKDAAGPYFAMPTDWQEFHQSHRKYRKKLSKLKKNLPDHSIDTYDTPHDIREGLEKFIELESSSWKKGQTGISRDQLHLDFYRALIPRLASKKGVAIKLLRNGNDLVAGEITYKFKDRLFFAQAAYNQKFAELSPGIVFAGLVIKDFSGGSYTIGDNLCGYADYLNPWATGIRKTTRVNILRKSTVTAALIAAWKMKRWITRKANNDISPGGLVETGPKERLRVE